ncbi:cytochrome P450 [Panaeolus papilionaceus]|nr:cytochrome P450 [Panaeolus papilionaceus]
MTLSFESLCTSEGILLCLFLVFSCSFWLKKSRLPLPPGPRGWPIIGNVFDMPQKREWEAFQCWGKEHNSDIVHLNMAGTSIVVLNSVKATKDLLEKRSSIYSNRTKFTAINEILGWSWLMPFMRYGAEWKERRRHFQRYFHPSTLTIHKPQEKQHIHRLLQRMSEDPKNHLQHITHAIGGILYSVAYGFKIKEEGDPYIALAKQITGYLCQCAVPSMVAMDRIPKVIRTLIQPLLPGPIFSKPKEYWDTLADHFLDAPFDRVRQLMAEGKEEPSFLSASLRAELRPEETEQNKHAIIKGIAAIVFIGGSGTTSAILHTFMLSMLVHPEIQAKAQEEIDRVIGRGRLPDYDDEPNLPYCSALMREVYRWHPAGPIGIPHFLDKDDEYGGYHIPKGSVVIANVWAMCQNEDDYPNPEQFNPERYLKDGKLDPSMRDPTLLNFGFGRRICPGMHMGLSMVWMTALSILATYKISKALDEKGKEIEPKVEFVPLITVQPVPFDCTITPRHEGVYDLLYGATDS